MKLIKTIYLTRHGATELNLRDIIQGRQDHPLSETGRREAKNLAEELKKVQLDNIYHSPLERAFETARVVNELQQVRLTKVNEFVEIDLGKWEDQKFTDVVEKDQEFYSRWAFDPNLKIPGGESLIEVYERVGVDVAKIIETVEKNVLIVAHATLNKAIMAHLLGIDIQTARSFRMKNCGLSKFLVYGLEGKTKIILDYWNQTGFLGEKI